MKCPNCNGEIKLGEKYCGRCGNPVPDEKSGKDEKKTGKKNAKTKQKLWEKRKVRKKWKERSLPAIGTWHSVCIDHCSCRPRGNT